MKNIKLKRLTQKRSAYQGDYLDPHIYQYGPYIITGNSGSWQVYTDVEVTRVELNYGMWDILINLSPATLQFPNLEHLKDRGFRWAKLKDCREWIAKEES